MQKNNNRSKIVLHKARVLMVQSTMSNAGKSFLVAGLCRIFARKGYRTAPFKSQNMALNSFITANGLEMGRAQVMQAEAAGIEPEVCMNPILLKPTTDTGSQVIVNGISIGNMSARDYFDFKIKLVPDIMKAFSKLEKENDIIVIEGAGSPAEINLRKNDIVNMGMAELADAPVLLVGDIDRGGVFAQLLGTLMLLSEREKKRVKGLVINKFRGDASILDSGIHVLEQKAKVPVTGVIPFMKIQLEDEDSLTERFNKNEQALIDLAVIRYPRISNFTDFNVFERMENVSVRYIDSASKLKNPDMIFLPGSKNTMADLKWMQKNGIEAEVKEKSGHIPVFGICGGYQMLGMDIQDPSGMEEGGSMRGMELLSVSTVITEKKVRKQTERNMGRLYGPLEGLSQLDINGYEIHMGRTYSVRVRSCGEKEKNIQFKSAENDGDLQETYAVAQSGNVYGTYMHGIFDAGNTALKLIKILAKRKNVSYNPASFMNYKSFKETQYDMLADTLTEYLDMDAIYRMMSR